MTSAHMHVILGATRTTLGGCHVHVYIRTPFLCDPGRCENDTRRLPAPVPVPARAPIPWPVPVPTPVYVTTPIPVLVPVLLVCRTGTCNPEPSPNPNPLPCSFPAVPTQPLHGCYDHLPPAIKSAELNPLTSHETSNIVQHKLHRSTSSNGNKSNIASTLSL